MDGTSFEAMKSGNSVWRILENPVVYRFSQRLLAPGSEARITTEVKSFLDSRIVPRHDQRNLEVGCGPISLLWNLELKTVGLDSVHSASVSFKNQGGSAITGSVLALPFFNHSFDIIWNFGLLHHLSDEMVQRAIGEMVRVVCPGGWVIMFDGVLPRSFWLNPPVWLLRKLDRGRHMRKQEELENLLPGPKGWHVKRFCYSLWGNEGILCAYRKN